MSSSEPLTAEKMRIDWCEKLKQRPDESKDDHAKRLKEIRRGIEEKIGKEVARNMSDAEFLGWETYYVSFIPRPQ